LYGHGDIGAKKLAMRRRGCGQRLAKRARPWPRLRITAIFAVAAFVLGLAHSWLHLANTDQHGHFAHGDQCCLVQVLGGGTQPPVIEVSPPQFVALEYSVPEAPEAPGFPPSVGYSARYPPIA
jgi:hypothetical protein